MNARHCLPYAPPILLALAGACGFASCFLYTINHDVSYMLHVAGRLLQGATLYVDVPEINPPLIVWLNVPIAWAALRSGLPAELLFRIAVLALALVSLSWSGSFVRRAAREDSAKETWSAWIGAGIGAVLLLPGYDFGQREHIALLCILPYLAEAGSRVSGRPASAGSQIGVAVVAVLGLGLKPYFLFAPLFVESYAAWRTRRLALGCLVAVPLLFVYAGAVLLLTPAYFDMVRLLASGYWGYSKGWSSFLTMPYFYASAMLAGLASLAAPRMQGLPRVLLLATLGFALSAIVQQKGWAYHWLPALALAFMLFGQAAVAATAQRQVLGMPLLPLLVAVAVALLASATLSSAWKFGHKTNRYPDELGPLIRELGGGPVIIFSSAFQASFPLVTEPGIGSSTRFPAMTIVPAMERGGNRAAVDWIHRAFAEDFYRQPPRLLLLETDGQGQLFFDMIPYFTPDVPELQAYQLVRRLPRFQVLARPAAAKR